MHATSHDGGTIRAASLVRVSTKGQADKGLSLDEQDRRVAKYISDQEWTPAGEYREPGVSGKRKDRPKLDRLLADAEARLLRPLRRRDGASHERPEAQRQGGTRAVEHLRLVAGELKLADIRSQVALTLGADLRAGVVVADQRQLDAAHSMLGEVVAWSRALSGLRSATPARVL